MLLMQAQKNGAILDEEQLLFIAGSYCIDNVHGKLSSADLINDEAGPSYDSDILSVIQDHDNYVDSVGEYHEYVKDNIVPVVQSNVSSMPNDALMMIINDMHEQSAQCVSEELLKKDLHSVKMQLNSTINHNKLIKEEVKTLKPDVKQKENKYLEEFLDMKQLKEKVEDKLYKQGCSRHMTGNRSRLKNFVKNFIGTIRFENDDFGPIIGYGDYMISDSVISRVIMWKDSDTISFLGQFYDLDLEVAFKKHSCYVRHEDGMELLKGSHGSNLYTISVENMMKSSPIYLLSKASKNKSWLWHHRLNHLNFGTINDLA
nr:integrase, catalytic region, zinc finger, CCHC-type, peptidase aspartic, catalytic [Tanacetum cinerariifolium]